MQATPKEYLYICDTRVDKLYEQINKSVLKRLSAELSIDLKQFGIPVTGAIKTNPPEETSISKLRLVEKYLGDTQQVGWIDAPKLYLKGTLRMDWEPVLQQGLVCFRGRTADTSIGMVGFAHFLRIDRIEGNSNDLSMIRSRVPEHPKDMLKFLAGLAELPQSTPDTELLALYQKCVAFKAVTSLSQYFEFLAVKLGDWADGTSGLKTLFCTPLYVAYAD